MEFVFVTLTLLGLAWPVIAVGAVVLIIVAVLAVRGDQIRRDRLRALNRAGLLLTLAAALTAISAYGYGLSETTFGLFTDIDDACAISRSGASPADGGSQSMWPLTDTTCGADLVPSFVNPLVVGSAVLFVALPVIVTMLKIWFDRRLRTATSQ